MEILGGESLAVSPTWKAHPLCNNGSKIHSSFTAVPSFKRLFTVECKVVKTGVLGNENAVLLFRLTFNFKLKSHAHFSGHEQRETLQPEELLSLRAESPGKEGVLCWASGTGRSAHGLLRSPHPWGSHVLTQLSLGLPPPGSTPWAGEMHGTCTHTQMHTPHPLALSLLHMRVCTHMVSHTHTRPLPVTHICRCTHTHTVSPFCTHTLSLCL